MDFHITLKKSRIFWSVSFIRVEKFNKILLKDLTKSLKICYNKEYLIKNTRLY